VTDLLPLLPDAPPDSDWPEELPPYLSATQLSMLERCPEQYRRRYILGEKDPPSSALVWGTVDGKAHGVNFTQKIETQADLPTAVVKDVFAELMDQEVDALGGAGEIDWRDDKPGDIKDRGVALAAVYHEQASPRIQPTAVEEEFSLQIPGVPVPFIGYIDVSTDTYTIERKTASAKSETIPVQYRFQALSYALARQRPVELHISTKTKVPAVYTPLEFPGLLLDETPALRSRVRDAISARARLLLALYTEFGPDRAWPDAQGTQAWHTAVCDLCGFRPRCWWWQ
jgi:hypothetical protein